MIEIFEGRLGGGKTYCAVRRIAQHMCDGLTVATNIELKWDGFVAYCVAVHGREPLPEQFINLQGVDVREFHRVTPAGSPGAAVLVVLDEAHLDFNARDWSQTSRELLAFLTQSRKQDTDVIFISQSAENVDKQFRRLIQYVWRFRDLARFKIPGLGIGWETMVQVLSLGFHSGAQILAVQYDYDGKQVMGREFVTKDKKVFAAYNTNALLSTFDRSGKRARVKLAKPRRSRIGAALLRVVMILGVLGLGWLYWQHKSKKAAAELPVASVKVLPVVPLERVEDVPPPKLSVVRSGSKNHAPTLRDLEEDKASGEMAYDIFSERFVAYSSRNGRQGPQLKTSGGTYRAGEMSKRGFVLGMDDRQARVLQPDGRIAWIVAEEEASSVPVRKGSSQEDKPVDVKNADAPEVDFFGMKKKPTEIMPKG